MIEIDASLIRHMTDKGKRIDYRKFTEYRKISIETGIITSAEGSARVRLGSTEVIAGVKMDVGEPFGDTPDEGVLMVAAEFVPLASPEFEAGPPREDAIELSRVVDRAIRESKCIDFKKLCLQEGQKVWMVYVDIDVLDDDGNLIDAAGIAAAAALLDTRIPELNSEGKVTYDEKGKGPLPMKGIPVSTTIAKISGKLLADPNKPETEAMDARLTIGTIDIDNQIHLCSMQKGGSHGITLEELENAIDLAMKQGDYVRELIKEKYA